MLVTEKIPKDYNAVYHADISLVLALKIGSSLPFNYVLEKKVVFFRLLNCGIV